MSSNFYRAVYRIYEDDNLKDPFKPLSFATLILLAGTPTQDEILVIREFDYATVPELVSTPLTPEERHTVRVLANSGTSGSTMYTIVDNRIHMSANKEDYIWKNGVHHTRGADIQLPIPSKNDSIIITHKSSIVVPVVTWEATDYLTADDLDRNMSQIFWTNHEMFAHLDYPNLFNVLIGQKSGIVPTGEDGIIPVSYFPAGIGATGEALSADLDGVRLQEVGNVINTIPFSGYQVEWREGDLDKWKPSVAWGYTGIENKPAGTVVTKRVGIYATAQTKLNHLGNVHAKRQHFGDGTEHHPRTGDMIGWFPSTSKWELTGSLVATTDIPWTDPEDTSLPTYKEWYPPYGSVHYDDGANDPNVDIPNDRYNLHWRTSTGKWEYSTLLKDILDYYTYIWRDNKLSVGSFKDFTYPVPPTWINQWGVETPVPGQLAAWDASEEHFRNYSYDTWDHPNVYGGSATITDPDDSGYTGGYTGDDLYQWYGWPDSVDPDDDDDDTLYPAAGAGWMLYWDSTLYGRFQDQDTEEPKGAFNVGLPLSWLPEIKTDMLTAADGALLQWKPNEAGETVLRLGPFLLEELGKVVVGTAVGQQPLDGTYLVWADNGDGWYPREVEGGIASTRTAKYLDTVVHKTTSASNNNHVNKMWGTSRVPRDCILKGFCCLQPKDGAINSGDQIFTDCGPGYPNDNPFSDDIPPISSPVGSAVLGHDYTYDRQTGWDTVGRYFDGWIPGGVKLYRKRFNWGDDPFDGEDYLSHPADDLTVLSNAYDGTTSRYADDSNGEFTQWVLLDRVWRNSQGGDPWLAFDIFLNKDDYLLVEFIDSPYFQDPVVYGTQYQRANCIWKIE